MADGLSFGSTQRAGRRREIAKRVEEMSGGPNSLCGVDRSPRLGAPDPLGGRYTTGSENIRILLCHLQ